MKLSDFTAQLEPIVFDPSVLENNAKRAATQVDWRGAKITSTEGARQSDPWRRYQTDAGTEINPDPNVKVKVKYKGSESDEPEESDSDEEPDEEAAMDAVSTFLRLFLKDASLTDDVHGVAADLMRDRARQKVDMSGSSFIKTHPSKVTHNSGYICDQEMIAKHLDQNELCITVENRLRDRVVREQADNANRSYWSGLFYLLRSQPEGSRICDIKNKVCLSTLIQKTLAA